MILLPKIGVYGVLGEVFIAVVLPTGDISLSSCGRAEDINIPITVNIDSINRLSSVKTATDGMFILQHVCRQPGGLVQHRGSSNQHQNDSFNQFHFIPSRPYFLLWCPVGSTDVDYISK